MCTCEYCNNTRPKNCPGCDKIATDTIIQSFSAASCDPPVAYDEYITGEFFRTEGEPWESS